MQNEYPVLYYSIMETQAKQLIISAIQRRQNALNSDPAHHQSLRLCNGFTEGVPDLAIDLLGRTAVIHDYSNELIDRMDLVEILSGELDFLQAVLLKRRNGQTAEERNGILLSGSKTDDFIEEHHVRYAIDLTMNHDNSFYSDTRLLRKYLLENMQGKHVLNTFAYTGSLGVAAAAGGAAMVLQTDLSEKFLKTAYRSASLNGLTFTRKNFRYGDFFPTVGALRKAQSKFDCVIVDPPFFSRTAKGVIDLANNPLNVINKLRPLAADNGIMIVVNNALYLSGKDFLRHIESICDGIYLRLEELISIPEDFCYTAPSNSSASYYPADPAPFNHPTKIVTLRIRCKNS